MAKIAYSKSPTTHAEQVEKLKSRGMVISDEAKALRTLQQINYYRLGAYWLGFEKDHASHAFLKNTTFDAVMDLYEFDRELRLLVLDAVERFEISARTQWTYCMSQAYGSHAHLIKPVHEAYSWERNIEDLKKETGRADEVFIKHLTKKYSEELPAIWAVSEIMSFGLLSKWYKSLRANTVRKNIARTYQVHPDVLESWLQHFTVIRNNCAHHSRLWNRYFDRVALMIPKRHPVLDETFFTNEHRLYNSLVILLFLMDTIAPNHQWREAFAALLLRHPNVPLAEMGFPTHWRDYKIWQ